LKKQDNKNIDQFFKENLTQHFPTDPALWQQAEKGIAGLFLRKKILYYSTTLLIICGLITFLWINSSTENLSTKSEKLSETSNQTSNLGEKSVALVEPEKIKETSDDADYNSNFRAIVSEVNSQNHIKNELASKKAIVNKGTSKPLLIDEEVSQEVKEIDLPGSDGLQKIEEVNLAEKESETRDEVGIINFEILELNQKLTQPFLYTTSSKPVLFPELKNKKRKFAMFLEFENGRSINTSLSLSKLSDQEKSYRKQSESLENTSSYGLNLILQKKGFGFVTGISQQSASIKTNYIQNYFTYEFETKYKMIKDSIAYKRGYYSQISEYNDTTASHAEQKTVENQSSQNTLNWLSIPVKFSYQYPVKRLRFSVRAGADFSWLYDYKGSLINSKLNQVVAIGDGEHALNKFNVNASLAIMAGYQLNKQFQVGGSVFGNQQLGSNFANYSGKFKNNGLGWYLRYSF
jgi:hypothetical protein